MKFLTDISLGKKITILTASGLLIGVGVFSSLGMQAVNRATETMLQDRLTTARLVADYIDESLERALSELKKTAQALELNDTGESLEAQINLLEIIYSRLSISIHGIYLLNEKGEITWSKPETPVAESSEADYFSSIIQDIKIDDLHVSGLISAPQTKVPVVFLISPTKTGPQRSNGSLVVAIDPVKSSIGGFVHPVRLGDTGYIEIIDQNGVVVARTQPGPELAPFEKSDHSGRFASLIRAGEPTQGVCHTCHEPEQRVERRDVLAFVPLSKASWGVVIRQSEEEALAPSRKLLQNLLLFGFALVIVAILFVIVTTRDVGNRIRMLTFASQKIAEGDLDSPVSYLGKDEVGILSQTLDDMRLKLKASYGELQQKTQELSSLLSVSDILSSTIDLSRLFDAVVARAVEVIPGTDGGALLLYSVDYGGLIVQSAIGPEKGVFPQIIATSNDQIHTQSIPEVDSANGKNIVKEAIANFINSEQFQSKIRDFICSDVLERNRIMGSLILVSFKESQVFSESDHRLLQAITDGIGIAIERAQLTEEAEEARALYEADRLRSQFISSVSHELRTPLTLIKGYSTSLLRQDVHWHEKTQREFLQIVDEKTDELRDLIDKLLQSAKLEAGAVKLEKEPLLMPHLAKKVVEDITPRAKKHKFSLEFTRSFPVIEADIRCIEQVIRNLVENAVKYSPDGGEIKISGEAMRDNIVVGVMDAGMGIPPEHREKIFDRFYRVDNVLTRGTSGSGLGLSIVKAHVEAHGGDVWFESKVGKGSHFYFSLPLSNATGSD